MKRQIALTVFLIISGLLIGTTIYQTYFANPVDHLPEYQQIDEFTLPSTTGENFTYTPNSHDVTVVSWMYTKCPGDTGCSLLTTNMAELETRVKNQDWEQNIEFISIDFDYINDTMDDLKHYAEERTSDFAFWKFLLGNKNQTDALAEDFGFFYAVNNGTESLGLSHSTPEGKDPYIHPMLTYVLDRTGTIRHLISGTVWDYIHIMNVLKFLQSDDWQVTQAQ